MARLDRYKNEKETSLNSVSHKRKSKRKKSNSSSRKKLFKRIFITIVIAVLIGSISLGGYAAYCIFTAPKIQTDKIYSNLEISTNIYDDKGELIDMVYYSENRKISTYEELPENLKNAFIAVEDKTFWKHKGFNFKRMIGAILGVFKGERISGTSTITQQLARNVFLPEVKSERSIKRKIIEMYYAYEIEKNMTKEEILTAYLNTIYLGYGCYGVETAAQSYFSCDVKDLTLVQCAALAALPKAPTEYALLQHEKGENTVKLSKGLYVNDTSQERRNLILYLMVEQGYIDAKQKKKATKPAKDFIKAGNNPLTSKSAFRDYLLDTVKKDLMSEYGMDEQQAINKLYTKGLNIYSTVDVQAQQAITNEFKKSKNFPKAAKSSAKVQAAMVIVEVGSGKIKAMSGARHATGEKLFNRAINPRQPGSAIKPLSVYSAALQKSYEYKKEGKLFEYTDFGYDRQGKTGYGDYITVSSKVIDEKMVVNGYVWPLNVTRSYSGRNTFRTAIQQSINTCAVKILAQVGIDYSMNLLKDYGITTLVDDTREPVNDYNYAALGLGAMAEGVSPLEMALAYGVFPGGGLRYKPICYTKVTDGNGKVLLETKKKSVRVLDEGVAWIMTDVLKKVVSNGIARDAAISGIQVGGKTGTTDDTYDIWFCGFTPTYSAALWIGTDDNVRMNTVSFLAAGMWSRIMNKIDAAKDGEYRKMPNNVIKYRGDYYTKGTEPIIIIPEKEEKEDEKEENKENDNEDNKKKPNRGRSKFNRDNDRDDLNNRLYNPDND
ncbi:MAG TPA: hypothetical protein GX736_04365 [Mogibacterium sp.]|nr:hypothetical protein [Mogibacterium sp.]